jgi:hypothetical protein
MSAWDVALYAWIYYGIQGPVAQWLEPAAHNGLVSGSSPGGPPLAGVAEFADALVLGTSDESRGGSSPPFQGNS